MKSTNDLIFNVKVVEKAMDDYLDSIADYVREDQMQEGEDILEAIYIVRRQIERGNHDTLMDQRNHNGRVGRRRQDNRSNVTLTDILNNNVPTGYQYDTHDDGDDDEYSEIERMSDDIQRQEDIIKIARSAGYDDSKIEYYIGLMGIDGFERILNESRPLFGW